MIAAKTWALSANIIFLQSAEISNSRVRSLSIYPNLQGRGTKRVSVALRIRTNSIISRANQRSQFCQGDQIDRKDQGDREESHVILTSQICRMAPRCLRLIDMSKCHKCRTIPIRACRDSKDSTWVSYRRTCTQCVRRLAAHQVCGKAMRDQNNPKRHHYSFNRFDNAKKN